MIGTRLRELRNQRGLLQKEIAAHLGISQQGVARWEKGQTEPDLETVKKLAEYFNCTTDYLLGKSIVRNPIDTIAARHDGDEFTEEELEDIEKFKEFVKMKRGKVDPK